MALRSSDLCFAICYPLVVLPSILVLFPKNTFPIFPLLLFFPPVRPFVLSCAVPPSASPPAGLSLYLVAGDAHSTPDVLEVEQAGSLRVRGRAPGDDTVTRSSALMDERTGTGYVPRVRTPIGFRSVLFLESDHLGLTRDRLFTNFVLYTLLEQPRD